jgi:hypothetical protein
MNSLEKLNQPITQVLELYRPKVAGIGFAEVAHAGVGFVLNTGETIVLHRTPDNGTHLSTLTEFSAGEKISTLNTFEHSLEDITSRAKAIAIQAKDYRVFNNCEHLKNLVLSGKPSSEQLNTALLSAGVGALFALGPLNESSKLTKTAAIVGASLFGLWITKKKKLNNNVVTE